MTCVGAMRHPKPLLMELVQGPLEYPDRLPLFRRCRVWVYNSLPDLFWIIGQAHLIEDPVGEDVLVLGLMPPAKSMCVGMLLGH